jgi:diguanylate cyclase (GGDEF)-like protein
VSDFAPHIDLMTGAWKREHFEGELAVEVRSAHRAGMPLTLLWMDVDDLCEHNDLHGRDALDAKLAWVAARIAQVVDGRGPIARVEGGAFAVILPGVNAEAARRLGEQVRRSVPRTLHASAFGDYRLTVSVGVAALRRTEPWGNLVEAAQGACCRAKQGGRDLVVAR